MHLLLFGTEKQGLVSLSPLFSTSPQVNIIPIIAKADTISKSELHKFKIKIMSELVSNGVQIYQFPTDDEAVSEINASMNVGSPAEQTHLQTLNVCVCFLFNARKHAEQQAWWHFFFLLAK